jgi:hypothetical protein
MKFVKEVDQKGLREVMRVTDFALQHNLKSDEQLRLLKLLGTFATKQELLMNAHLSSKTR